jgi:hypothetical protein
MISSQNNEDLSELKTELLVEIVKLRCARTLSSFEKELEIVLPNEVKSDRLLSSPRDLALSLMELCTELSWAAHIEILR